MKVKLEEEASLRVACVREPVHRAEHLAEGQRTKLYWLLLILLLLIGSCSLFSCSFSCSRSFSCSSLGAAQGW